MGLTDTPPTRNTTYAALQQVKSVDLNEIQDGIARNFGDGRYKVPATAAAHIAGPGVFTADGDFSLSNNTDVISLPIKVPPSCRLIAVRARVTDQPGFGTGAFTLTVRKNVDGTGSTVGTPQASDASGNPQTLAVTGLTEDQGAAGAAVGTQYSAQMTLAGSGPATVHGFEIETEPLP
jgi:hypothetical protein